MNKLKTILTMTLLPMVMLSCGSGLNVVLYRGDPVNQRVYRDIVVDGKKKKEGLMTNDSRFSKMQCLFDHDVKKYQELYNRAVRAGVKVDDL